MSDRYKFKLLLADQKREPTLKSIGQKSQKEPKRVKCRLREEAKSILGTFRRQPRTTLHRLDFNSRSSLIIYWPFRLKSHSTRPSGARLARGSVKSFLFFLSLSLSLFSLQTGKPTSSLLLLLPTERESSELVETGSKWATYRAHRSASQLAQLTSDPASRRRPR